MASNPKIRAANNDLLPGYAAPLETYSRANPKRAAFQAVSPPYLMPGAPVSEIREATPFMEPTPLTPLEPSLAGPWQNGIPDLVASQTPSVSDDGARGQMMIATLRCRVARENSGHVQSAADIQHTCTADWKPTRPRTKAKAIAVGDVVDDHNPPATQPPSVIHDIIELYYRHRQEQKMRTFCVLQAKATTRRAAGGDKDAGNAMFANPDASLAIYLAKRYDDIARCDAELKLLEKQMGKLAAQLPVAQWAADIAGLSLRFLAMIVGAAGRPISDYRNPSCLWKRMGMAVIEGERQRRKAGAEDALKHGYDPERRALMWNVEASIMKQQVRKTETGERHGTGYYGEVYCARRVYEAAIKGEKYSHDRAKRYMGKRLLRELWKAWRDAETGGA